MTYSEEINCEVVRIPFLAKDPILPLENHEVEKTEAERKILCERMLYLMKHPKKLPDDMEKNSEHHVKTFSLLGKQ